MSETPKATRMERPLAQPERSRLKYERDGDSRHQFPPTSRLHISADMMDRTRVMVAIAATKRAPEGEVTKYARENPQFTDLVFARSGDPWSVQCLTPAEALEVAQELIRMAGIVAARMSDSREW